jgi:hypothetical protein
VRYFNVRIGPGEHRFHYLAAAPVFPGLNRPGREAYVKNYFVNYFISPSLSSDGKMLDDLKCIWKEILAACSKTYLNIRLYDVRNITENLSQERRCAGQYSK